MQLSTISQRFLAFTLAMVLCAGSQATGQAGSLDPTFGTNGIFTATTVRLFAAAVAIQTDGKIVVAGGAVANNNFADTLIRLNPNGTLDTTFGSGGIVTIEPAGGFFALVIQPNGEIVAAGEGPTVNNAIVQVARFKTNGSLDPSFGSGGITTTGAIPFTPFNATGALALQPNGEILVAASNPGVMARFTTSGQLDTTFGTGGVANLTNGGPSLAETAGPCPTRIAVQTSGTILVAAGVHSPTPGALAGIISRYNSNGSLDTTFGAGGQVASVASASALLLQSNGKIVVAGTLTSKIAVPPAINDVGFGIVRYSANGAIDSTFGTGGVAVADFGATFPLSGAFALAIQSNGDLVAGGAAGAQPTGGNTSSFGLARFTSAGVLDTTFGTGGEVTTTFDNAPPAVSFVTGLAIQSDGKIVAVGTSTFDIESSDAYVARYLGQ